MQLKMSPNHHRSIPPSPAKVVQEESSPPLLMKQGIVTILNSDDGERSKSASIRRTLSADMSSKKWLQQNGFFSPAIKKTDQVVIPSSFSSSSSSSVDEEEDNETIPCQGDVWRSIQTEKERNQNQIPQQQPAAATNVWGSMTMILSHQKSENNINSLIPPPPAYVHPLVKRSGSTLSEKSLEICTESLGSETGSDCPSSEMMVLSDSDERERVVADHDEVRESAVLSDPFEGLHVVKYKKSPARPFPPPLPSIAGASDGGASIHVTSRRDNGRLVLEAVSVPARNYFRSDRQDGRLVLTLVRTPEEEEKKVEDFEKVFDDMEEVGGDDGDDDVETDDDCDDDVATAAEEVSLPSGMVSVHKSGLVMKKFTEVGNLNPKMWSKNFNKASSIEIISDINPMLPNIPQSLPPVARMIPSQAVPPLTTVAASFNAYEYFWRNKTTAISGGIKNSGDGKFDGRKGYGNEDLEVRKGSKEEYYCVPYLKGCKEPRRSLSIWEDSYCIATS